MTLRSPERRVGSILRGRLQLLAVLGAGPHGVVYEAVDLPTGDRLAVKLLGAHFEHPAPGLRGGDREVALRTRIHPQVVTATSLGRLDDGRLYLTMELVRGLDLAAVLEAGPLPPRAALRIIRQALHALRQAHLQGIVHGGLKPSNLMLAEVAAEDPEAGVRVLDLSLSILFGPGDRTVIPPYGAPEQLRGPLVTPATDCHALGVVLAELMTGAPPASPDDRAPSWSDELSFLIWRALQPSPRDRYGTAVEMIAGVDAALRALARPTR